MQIIETFFREGLPGMVLTADGPKPAPKPAPPVKPLLPRCACGKVISQNKYYCFDCLVDALEQIINGTADEPTVQKVVRQSTSAERGRMMLTIPRLRAAAALLENQL